MSIHAEIIQHDSLSPKETEVLKLLCDGMPDKLIARQLAISIKTVEVHCGHIYQKLQIKTQSVNNRCAAIGEAVARGLVVLSRDVVCVVLMVSALQINDDAARVGRLKLPRVQVTRVKTRD